MSELFVAMKDYSDHSFSQHAVAVLLSEMIEKWLNEMTIQTSSGSSTNINVVEYGCATGSSSLDPLSKIQAFANMKGLGINLVMNDLPLNDWNELQDTLHKNVPSIKVQLSIQSMMYDGPVTHPGTIDISYSCFAQHWLSKGVPCSLPLETGAMWGNQLTGLPRYENLRLKWAKAANDDWDRFLTLRAKEVRVGGIMVLAIQSCIDGRLQEKFAHSCQLAKKKCTEVGIITMNEAKLMVMPEYNKTSEEILEPFKNANSPHALNWDVLDHFRAPFDTCSKCIVESNMSDEEKANEFIQLARSFMDTSIGQAFENSVREEKLNLFWKMVLEISDNDYRKLKTDFLCDMIALKRREPQGHFGEEKKEEL